MKVASKNKFLSLFFLLLFLFPTAQKALHDYGHANDFHCSDTVTVHFHAGEHDCSLCDFQVTPSVETSQSSFSEITFTGYFFFIVSPVKSVCTDYFSFRSARAPPIA